MKCKRCGRGATWSRLERNPWVLVMGLGGFFDLCWLCADVWDFDPTDRLTLIFGDTSGKLRRCRLHRNDEEAA